MGKQPAKIIMRAAFFVLLAFTLSCGVNDKRLVGVYKTSNDDTLKLIEDHSFRIELTDPDTVELNQFKIATGRWSTEKRKLMFNMDSRSMGQYWECQPLNIGWRRLSRPKQCAEKGNNLVFKKIKVKKVKKGKGENEKKPVKEKKKKKSKEEEAE